VAAIPGRPHRTVLLLGVLVSNLVGIAVYSGERLDVLTSARGRQIAEQVAAAAAALQETPEYDRRRLLRSMRQPGLRLFWSNRPFAGEDTGGWRSRLIRSAFLAEFGSVESERLRLSIGPRFTPPPDADDRDDERPGRRYGSRGVQPGWSPGAPDLSVLAGSYRLDDGSWLNFAAAVATFRPFWATPFFLVIIGTTALVLGVSVWAVRRAAAPLSMFGEAAERLGRDVDAPPLPVGGPLEVEQAALAFNLMQERLQKFIHDRTQMLAAISHDLRTPLTRLRLRAELIEDDEQQKKTIADLDEMQRMIEAVLSFARNEAEVEKPAALDLAALLQTVCEEAADAGASAKYFGPQHATCFARPTALKRAFANLVDNALKYGERARITLEAASASLVVTIEDDGPGVPLDELDRVFEPFYRLETSRSRETGGAGLGLALVRAAIAAHGGDVVLGNRPEGGLRATVTLPVGTGGAVEKAQSRLHA
jgi:signal transduction histidine kinase